MEKQDIGCVGSCFVSEFNLHKVLHNGYVITILDNVSCTGQDDTMLVFCKNYL